MGFQPPVPQEYSTLEIRVAVLVSLSMQVALIFLSPYRKRTNEWYLRFMIWSLYLLADWVADLALGLLLNNIGNIGGDNGNSPIIFSLWAPFLLLHLGGPDTITAFSLEDNELWLRHLVGLLFELISTAIIFSCSIHNNPFVIPSVLIFVVGTIKYLERSYCLYLGSMDGFRVSIFREAKPGFDYGKLMEVYSSRKNAGLPVELVFHDGNASSRVTTTGLGIQGRHDSILKGYEFFERFKILWGESRLLHPLDLFSDLSSDQSIVQQEIKSKNFAANVSSHVQVTEVELNFIYDVVYTKAKIIHSRTGYVLRGFCSTSIIAAILVFFFLDKRQFKHVDVIITYVLLFGAFFLDITSLMMLICSNWTYTQLAKSKSSEPGKKISEIVHTIRGKKAFKNCDLLNELSEEDRVKLQKTTQLEFDQSLLLWHIVTEICYHDNQSNSDERNICKTLSDYMLYLLIKQPPFLLSSGLGLLRYRDTCAEARRYFKRWHQFATDEHKACQLLKNVETPCEPEEIKGIVCKSLLFDACIIAKIMLKAQNKARWEMIAEVWAEMVVHAAIYCKGDAHARHLSQGGEFITVIWFLIAHVGIKETKNGFSKATLIVEK
ncbi:hypothetical protein LUZ61_016492 [Rhynchospora tenuis]|uniref:DUF4220 domain-containing protein n=1 Tax=Rhynchospora tenuis TaxID=198213 RepID=A0AAD5Z5M9_9POAL|nr:hypothetical protein LUZ61_016492 [Rhynchospora tenuis]